MKVETVDFKNFFFQPFLFLSSDSGIKLFNNNTNNANTLIMLIISTVLKLKMYYLCEGCRTEDT